MAETVAGGAGESSLSMPEELAFDEPFRQGTAVDRNETAASPRLPMDFPCVDFLARAALPFDNNSRLCYGDAPNLGVQLTQRWQMGRLDTFDNFVIISSHTVRPKHEERMAEFDDVPLAQYVPDDAVSIDHASVLRSEVADDPLAGCAIQSGVRRRHAAVWDPDNERLLALYLCAFSRASVAATDQDGDSTAQ